MGSLECCGHGVAKSRTSMGSYNMGRTRDTVNMHLPQNHCRIQLKSQYRKHHTQHRRCVSPPASADEPGASGTDRVPECRRGREAFLDPLRAPSRVSKGSSDWTGKHLYLSDQDSVGLRRTNRAGRVWAGVVQEGENPHRPPARARALHASCSLGLSQLTAPGKPRATPGGVSWGWGARWGGHPSLKQEGKRSLPAGPKSVSVS